MENLLNRIVIDPEICHGKPCIRGLRYPVEMILELLSSDMDIDEILQDYEDLVKEDIKACLIFASRILILILCIIANLSYFSPEINFWAKINEVG